MLENDKNGEQL